MEIKKITGFVSEEIDNALDESARKKNKKKMPYIGEIIEKYLQEENDGSEKTSKRNKKTSS